MDSDPENYNLSHHVLTCCGVDCFLDSVVAGARVNTVAQFAGDFGGNIIVWKHGESKPFAQTKVSDPVRSLAWRSDGAR